MDLFSEEKNICMKLIIITFVLFGSVLLASRSQALTIGPGDGDVALNKTAKASSTYSYPSVADWSASLAVDGTDTTTWNAGGWGNSWLAVDLQQAYLLSHVDLYSAGQSGGVYFTLYYSTDSQAWNNDSNWTLIGSGALYFGHSPVSIDFNDIEVRYLKVALTSGGDWIALNEIAAYSSENAVPEPTTMLLFGTGIAGLIAVRRKKKA